MRESCSIRAKLALCDLEIKGQKVSGLHIFFFYDRKQSIKYQTYSEETETEETLQGDLELEG